MLLQLTDTLPSCGWPSSARQIPFANAQATHRTSSGDGGGGPGSSSPGSGGIGVAVAFASPGAAQGPAVGCIARRCGPAATSCLLLPP